MPDIAWLIGKERRIAVERTIATVHSAQSMIAILGNVFGAKGIWGQKNLAQFFGNLA
jgi:hypothetical protein